MMCFIIALVACTSSTSFSEYKSIGADGWHRQLPLKWHPQVTDSTATYSVDLAVRHTSAYKYGNLAMRVDFIAADGALTSKQVVLKTTDDNGNWKGSGFGALYQCRMNIATGMKPQELSTVVVWQVMDSVEVLSDVAEVGLFLMTE